MDVSALIINVAILFIMMLPGYLLKKCKMCPEGFGKGLANLVLYIAQPVLIVYAYLDCEAEFSQIWSDVLAVFIISLIAHAIFSAVAIPVFRKAPEGRDRMLKFATIFSNAAFMGIPLIQAIFADRPEMAIYASVYNISFNLFLWTLGVLLCTGGEVREEKRTSECAEVAIPMLREKHTVSLKKVLFHPVTLASAVGIILLVTGVKNSLLREAGLGIIPDAMDMLRSLVAPLSMTVIGLRLSDIKFHGFLNDAYMYLFLLLRQLALPLAVLGIMKLSILVGIPLSNDTVTVITVLAATPAASSATMFAEKYDCDALYTSRLVIVSTILCILTMPLVLMLV
ncbi:MAG: AEC family transporter [Clostridia bacterium]|nr:AEC family transporter [Clostridia bacterium]